MRRQRPLVGRDAELEGFEILLERLRNGYAEQSMLITARRQDGAAGRVRRAAQRRARAEIGENEPFGPRGALVRRALPGGAKPWGERRGARRRASRSRSPFVGRLDDRGHRRRRGPGLADTATSATT
jgi:hypothetical protein